MKRSPIRKRSKKKTETDRVFAIQRDRVLERDGGWCQCGMSGCRGRADVVHHIAGRGFLGQHELENLVSLCRPCHDWIHSHPMWAYESGFMRRRT